MNKRETVAVIIAMLMQKKVIITAIICFAVLTMGTLFGIFGRNDEMLERPETGHSLTETNDSTEDATSLPIPGQGVVEVPGQGVAITAIPGSDDLDRTDIPTPGRDGQSTPTSSSGEDTSSEPQKAIRLQQFYDNNRSLMLEISNLLLGLDDMQSVAIMPHTIGIYYVNNNNEIRELSESAGAQVMRYLQIAEAEMGLLADISVWTQGGRRVVLFSFFSFENDQILRIAHFPDGPVDLTPRPDIVLS